MKPAEFKQIRRNRKLAYALAFLIVALGAVSLTVAQTPQPNPVAPLAWCDEEGNSSCADMCTHRGDPQGDAFKEACVGCCAEMYGEDTAEYDHCTNECVNGKQGVDEAQPASSATPGDGPPKQGWPPCSCG